MSIVCRTHVHLNRLRFPFAVRVQALRGTASLRNANARREVWPGDPFVVPPFVHFDCHLPATARKPCTIMLTAVPDAWCSRMAVIRYGKHWSRALARLVFEHPGLAWNAALVGDRWQATPRQVRARLFAEGEALHSLVREQRAALAFYALTRSDMNAVAPPAQLETIVRQAGTHSAATFAGTCVDLFEADPHELIATGCQPVLSEVLASSTIRTGR